MKVFIVGLGLMGSSYALGLSKNGYQVFGFDQNEEVTLKALKDEIILSKDLKHLTDADIILMALYPKENIDFVKAHHHLFKKGQMITDLAGVKLDMTQEIEAILDQGISYTSHHPMAGREKSGYAFKNTEMFKNANFIIISGLRSIDRDFKRLEDIAYALEFGKILTVDAKTHDALIGYTSQLTHAIAVSLMHANRSDLTTKATGDSFRDLTRIAKINAEMWTELFIENKVFLLDEINNFINALNHLKHLIETDDVHQLIQYLNDAKEMRKQFD